MKLLCKNRKLQLPVIISVFIIILITTGIFAYREIGAGANETETASVVDEEFEASIADFPESYKPYLRTLHEAHPTWKFIAFDTGLEWSEVLSTKNEMYLGRNLVPNAIMGINGSWYKTPSSWKDTTITGAFNWSANDWVELCGGNWVQASQTAVEYVMDPRNWLTEENIFEFEMLSFNSEYQTFSLLRAMMEDTFMDFDYAKVGGSAGKSYATVLMEAGQAYNVSPIHLCARIIQEKGRGTYNEETGKYELKDSLATGVVGTDGKTYYNFFNIGASGNTTDAVIKNGTAEAQSAGWTTQYKAILGGASKVASGYIDIGQDTIYFQKFSVVNPDYYYWKQYMQNLLAPVNEGYNIRNTYAANGLLDSSFVFRIPVYHNMPEKNCPAPSGDGNPNYKLKSLSVTGTYMDKTTEELILTPTFNTDTLTYSIVVPYKMSSIKILAEAYAKDTSTLSGTGIFNLKVGTTAYTVTCKAENGNSRKYKINITRLEGSTLLTSLGSESGVLGRTFASDVQQYNLYVSNATDSLTVNYTTESSSATVVLRSKSGSVTCKNNKAEIKGLSEGKNTYYLDVYPSSDTASVPASDVRTYTVNIIRFSDTGFDISGYQISGSLERYAIQTCYINGFNIGDTVAAVKKKLNVNNGRVTVLDSGYNELSDKSLIGTGDIIEIYDGNGFIMYKFYVVLYGDVNGDGKVDLLDLAYYQKQYWVKPVLTGIKLRAADVYPASEGIDLLDLAIIQKYIWRDGKISQTR